MITIIVAPCFDIRIMRLASLKNEPVAVLHVMRLESTVCLFLGVIEKLQRGWKASMAIYAGLEMNDYKIEKEMKRSM